MNNVLNVQVNGLSVAVDLDDLDEVILAKSSNAAQDLYLLADQRLNARRKLVRCSLGLCGDLRTTSHLRNALHFRPAGCRRLNAPCSPLERLPAYHRLNVAGCSDRLDGTRLSDQLEDRIHGLIESALKRPLPLAAVLTRGLHEPLLGFAGLHHNRPLPGCRTLIEIADKSHARVREISVDDNHRPSRRAFDVALPCALEHGGDAHRLCSLSHHHRVHLVESLLCL